MEEKGRWINELISYEAVYRTAPATPGLLDSWHMLIDKAIFLV